MDVNSNRKVLRFLRICEVLASLACGIYHVISFNNPEEPNTQEARFIIPFFGFSFVSCFAIFKFAERYLSLILEVVSSSIGASLFFYTSIQSMINIENDKHMEILDERMEFEHPFFVVSKGSTTFN